MTFWNPDLSRRHFLRGGLALGAAALFPAHLFAEELLRTPRLTEGPFYPDKLPLDTDNDLIIINDDITPAVGEITHLTGRVLDAERRARSATPRSRSGSATRNAGLPPHRRQRPQGGPAGHELPGLRPVHDRLQGRVPLPHDQAGPVPRPARPHIHFKVKKGGPGAADHPVLHRRPPGQRRATACSAGVRDPIDRELVLADFKPIKGSKIGELAARFDIVVGLTPAGPRPASRRR